MAISCLCTSTTALTKSPNCCSAILRSSSRDMAALTICVGMRRNHSMWPPLTIPALASPLEASVSARTDPLRLEGERARGELAVGAAAHGIGLPADEAGAREHAGIDGRARPLALKHGGDLAAEATARLRRHACGGRGNVRGHDDVVHVEERVHGIHGFLLEDVQGRSRDLLLLEGLDQGGLVHGGPAAVVDEQRGL